MMVGRLKRPVLGAAIICLVGIAVGLSMQPINLGQIVQYTEKGFEGVAVSVEVVQVDNDWAEKVTFKVTDPVIGSVQQGDTVTWFQVRSGKDFVMAGMPQYTPGHTYMIFLSGTAPGSQLQSPVGLGQGSFQVHVDMQSGEKFARNEFQNTALFQNVNLQELSADLAEITTGVAAGRSIPGGISTGSSRAAKAAELSGKLSGGPAGATSLQTLKSAAKLLKSNPNPAGAYGNNGLQADISVPITP